jgi:hypothetical protein
LSEVVSMTKAANGAKPDCLDERDRLDGAFHNIEGVVMCLGAAAESPNDVRELCGYLAVQLSKHAEAGTAAFAEIWAKRGAV